jgi:hypothetical protein
MEVTMNPVSGGGSKEATGPGDLQIRSKNLRSITSVHQIAKNKVLGDCNLFHLISSCLANPSSPDSEAAVATVSLMRVNRQWRYIIHNDPGLQRTLRIAHAKDIIATIPSLPAQATALIGIAQIQIEAGDIAEAQATCILAKAIAATIADPHSKANTLSDIATAQLSTGNIEAAQATPTLAKAIVATSAHSTFEKAYALFEIAKAEASADDIATAQATCTLVKAITDADTDHLTLNLRKDKTLREIATAQAKAEHFEAAKATAATIENNKEKITALLNILESVKTPLSNL